MTDIDIETVSAIIEVKSHNMGGIEGQVELLVNSPILNPTGKPVFVYRGDGNSNKNLRLNIEAKGGLLFGKEDRQTLIDLVGP